MNRYKKYLGTGFLVVLATLAGLLSPLFLPQVHSQNVDCTNVTPRISNGILTTPNLITPSLPGQQGGFGNSTGQCVINLNQAGIVSFKIPTYDDLKNIYFQRKAGTAGVIDKQTIATPLTGLNFTGGGCGINCSRLWNINGDLSIRDQTDITLLGGPLYQNAIIFVEGDLNIGDLNTTFTNVSTDVNIQYGDNNTGIVYIVRGNVNFGRNVHSFDGIIIAQGDSSCTTGPPNCYSICSSYDGNCREDTHQSINRGGETKQLIINGNLISLNSTHPIRFMRNLIFSNGNITPAEIVNVQPKYLVIMRNLLSETLSIQTEDTHFAINQ